MQLLPQGNNRLDIPTAGPLLLWRELQANTSRTPFTMNTTQANKRTWHLVHHKLKTIDSTDVPACTPTQTDMDLSTIAGTRMHSNGKEPRRTPDLLPITLSAEQV